MIRLSSDQLEIHVKSSQKNIYLLTKSLEFLRNDISSNQFIEQFHVNDIYYQNELLLSIKKEARVP